MKTAAAKKKTRAPSPTRSLKLLGNKNGVQGPEPATDRLMLRLMPSQTKKYKLAAKKAGKKVAPWAKDILDAAAAK